MSRARLSVHAFPYADPHRVVSIQIRDTNSARPGGRIFFQVPEFLDYQLRGVLYPRAAGDALNPMVALRYE